ncbi:MAG: NUDIX domain-containing protein, partial [Anaerolineae bacterium]|nr:NUDIX domain-containing protein [Anaerolineae bacterium]
RRQRQMCIRDRHRAARMIVNEHAGRFPPDVAVLQRLPGIGRYTAGAILSLAFGQRAAVLDGNVRRVLCRLYDIAADPREAAVETQLWQLATALVETVAEEEAGPLNEALMELGSLICTPRQPACAACPVAHLCLAHAHGVEAERPIKRSRGRPPHYPAVAAVIRDAQGACLLIRRPVGGLLGGLWGFPGGVLEAGEAPVVGLRRTVLEQVGIEVVPDAEIARIEHAYSHFRITLHAWQCRIVAGEPQPLRCAAVHWATAAEWDKLAFPATDSRIIQALTARV